MKKLSIIFASLVLVFGVSKSALAQDNDTDVATHGIQISIPTVTLVDVEGAGGEAATITLNPTTSTFEAGSASVFNDATDATLWLNYTSIIGSEQALRTIEVSISENLPDYLSLKLLASGASNNGKGTLGEPAGEITLSTTANNLITGIGSAYTGTGQNKGHQLTYSLSVDNEDFESLFAYDNDDITVTYTITGE